MVPAKLAECSSLPSLSTNVSYCVPSPHILIQLQELKAVMQVKPASWGQLVIIPSFFSRDGQFQKLSGQNSAKFASSQVTGWTTTTGTLTCGEEEIGNEESNQEPWQYMNPREFI